MVKVYIIVREAQTLNSYLVSASQSKNECKDVMSVVEDFYGNRLLKGSVISSTD